MRNKVFGATLAASLLYAAGAWAVVVPTTSIDGISIPLDSVSGGAVFTFQDDRETLLSGVGSVLSGAGIVSKIEDFPNLQTTYNLPCTTVGCSGTFLTD